MSLNMTADRSILVLLGVRGGGDRQPAIALASGLRDRGHRVTVLCDTATEQMIKPTGLSTITLPPEVDQSAYLTHGFVIRWSDQIRATSGQPDASSPNPLVDWATAAHPASLEAMQSVKPDLILGSLFCMGQADQLAKSAGIPWCFVNPGFYFGDHSIRRWEQDYYGAAIQWLAEYCLYPLARHADMVLHATDPEFDYQPLQLPSNHHYVGFLLWEATNELPELVDQPGDPWALVTLSTAPQREELTLAHSALQALADQPVRTLLTVPGGKYPEGLEEIPANVTLSGFVPHTPVLERSSIVISHAGHGLVSKALFNGVPMVLLPWDRDQPGVAARAERLGVAQVVPRPEVNPDTVGRAVSAVFSEPEYRETAARESGRLKKIDAVDMACRLVESM
jgi:UDP:flavonoid glycosyltransferase YjiC (YdhE family)